MKKFASRLFTGSGKLLILSLFLFGCNQDPILWKVTSDQQVISDYVASNDEYSEFSKLIEVANLNGLLSVRGPFTLLLPTNDVMEEYYKSKGVSSYEQLDAKTIKDLVYNHLIISEVHTSDIGLGAIRDTNALGDYLSSEFEGSDIIINKSSKITKRDIQAANGVIHLIDKVIEPVTKSVYELLAGNPSYSLFTKGLDRTGLKDTLNTISFPYGKKIARNRFTVLAVPDTIYNRYGITNIDELVAYFTSAPDSVTFLNNGFYRYMEYHCLGGAFYLDNLETKNYPTLSNDNNVSFKIDDAYRINNDASTGVYTSFIIDASNNPCKNGTYHTINDLLPVILPSPAVIVFETTDYFDLKQGDYFGKFYMRWFDGQNTFAKIKWEGDYLLYYFKDHDTGKLLNDDCLSMSGWWWCQVTTPKIMKGKYKVTSNLWGGQTTYAVYIDGVKTAIVNKSDPAESTSWGEFVWNNTEEHTIKVVTLESGLLFWDTIIFTPIN
ncbi:MAG: fasciclin domain-containing protein [Bacteroidales bacterium]|nr:fasciclin domain-containing protein [Bacteroidales bacterium]MCB9013597.1 fasciclin domain-containing protein [Bacteroidales bacterium]